MTAQLLSIPLPMPGNPMRGVVVLITAAFGAMAVVFPGMMLAFGLGVGWALFMAVLVLAVAALCLWMMALLSQVYDRQLLELRASPWATWELEPAEHRRHVASERRRTMLLASLYAVGGVIGGGGLAVATDDRLLGGVVAGAFLFAAFVILALHGPPRGGDRTVLLGPNGVQVSGRLLPIHAPSTRLLAVRIDHDASAVLRFEVRTARRIDTVRVPVPRDHEVEAVGLVRRYRETHGLTNRRPASRIG